MTKEYEQKLRLKEVGTVSSSEYLSFFFPDLWDNLDYEI